MFVDADGCRIHVEVEGPERAPVVLFSNSLGTNLHMWDEQATTLAKHFRVVRYDQRGHGQSDAPAGPYSLARLGQDVIAILNHLGVGRAHFCGLSMGGVTGMWLGLRARNRVAKLVLANTGAKIGDPLLWNGRIRTVLRDGMEPLVDAVVERWFTPGFRKRATRTVDHVRAMLLSTSPQGYAGCGAAIRDMDQRWAVAGIKAKTLVIAGRHDPATPLSSSELIASRVKGAKLVVLDTAHISNIERAAAFTDAVETFLRKD